MDNHISYVDFNSAHEAPYSYTNPAFVFYLREKSKFVIETSDHISPCFGGAVPSVRLPEDKPGVSLSREQLISSPFATGESGTALNIY